ncbi:asparaginase [Azospirillum picis]|uniref:L-asparaginase II n=1 Tax=Azospirillum picis TaxID=488438 RepID=A0ABU0MJY6_9PROT|nr:asparaginase [Azospirillum picis]MBP2299995.1 L-asparaginase II [Azospirillum picis]MDQ0533767.1 L-asparaginase II [Azospirillum picis]
MSQDNQDSHGHSSCCGGHHHPAGGGKLRPGEGGADLGGPADSPITVEVTRGTMVESIHRARACIVDAAGHVLARWGDIEAPVYARSAIKSLQAIPLVETGALDAFALGDEELALACSSHNGEARHTGLARAWAERVGLSVGDYECGAQVPYDPETAADLLRRGEAPTAFHNNCSGKHTGFLTTAMHKGERLKGYVRYGHPVQQRILGVLEQMTGQDLSGAPWGIDGCSIPTIGIPLGAIAYAMARIADPIDLPDARAEAVTRIARAWGGHPFLIAGTGTFDTAVMEAAEGAVLVKGGAEGVGCAVIPDQGIGIALKIEDGAARAREVAMAALIRATGALSDAQWARVPDLLTVPLLNRAGTRVGELRPAAGWPR